MAYCGCNWQTRCSDKLSNIPAHLFNQRVVFFGLQYFIKHFLLDAWNTEFFGKGYLFRARKTVELPEGKFAETKYRCRSCSHEWWERIPAPPEKKPADEAA
ncbi:hypothetical protein [Limnoglobus roseus]|uniref:Nicotinate phosphoribosyltransferase n=1 Tax=Limnoglobus roseus TaxID=2598579 RepID=A0A5C1AN66_9BACT|nr:hypothetical protein [Limnoglobus roseus]QEL19172.1 nicotinate phosphoribosyltransferase [Limnoglobus roseus]